MFNLFKKSDPNKIYAPIDGKCIDIMRVKDSVFSSKMMGDGIGIIPTTNIVKAPVSGKLTMLFPTKHAFGITTKEGIELLIHIGIDTVNLNGLGFKAYALKDQEIKKGDKIIEFNIDYLKDPLKDMTTIIVLPSYHQTINKYKLNEDVTSGDVVMTTSLKE